MKQIIYLLMLLAMVGVVIAAPPFIEAEAAGTLGIAYPQTPYLLANNGDISFHFHVFNSTGYKVIAPQTNCTAHVYNSTHDHVLEVMPVPMDSNGVDYKIVLGTNITHHPQTYSYIIQCYNTAEAGWVESVFTIAYGEDMTSGEPLAVMILIPLIFGLILIAGAGLLAGDHTQFKIFIYLFAIGMVLVSIGLAIEISIRYYGWTAIVDTLGFWVWIIGIFLFFLFGYLCMYLFDSLWREIQKASEEKKSV